MTMEQLRKVHQAKPFAPFTMRLADGSTVRVPSPEFLWAHPRGRTVIVATGDEDFEIVDLLLVAAIEVGDGQTTRRRKRK